MSLKEKKVTAEIVICDYCDAEVSDTGTHIEGATSGYMKRDHFAIDLCEACAQKVGLKRRGRKPGATTTTIEKAEKTNDGENAPKRKRGRPRKSEQSEAPKELVAVSANANGEDDWESN